jgi:hypothetical protein
MSADWNTRMESRSHLTATRERIIAAHIRKLELRQAKRRRDDAAQPTGRSSGLR